MNEVARGDGDPLAVGRDRAPGDPRAAPRDRRGLVPRDAVGARRRSQPAALEEVAAIAGPGDEPGIARRLPEGATRRGGEDLLEGGEIRGGRGEAIGIDGAERRRRREASERREDAHRLALSSGVEGDVDRGVGEAGEADAVMVVHGAEVEITFQDSDA